MTATQGTSVHQQMEQIYASKTIPQLAEQLSLLMRVNGIGKEVRNSYQYVKAVPEAERVLMSIVAKQLTLMVDDVKVDEIVNGVSAPKHTELVWANRYLTEFYKVAGEDAAF